MIGLDNWNGPKGRTDGPSLHFCCKIKLAKFLGNITLLRGEETKIS